MTIATAARIPLRVRLAIYGTGIFSNSANIVVAVIVPLWLIELQASPFMVGLALGGRYLLPTLLSIHGGALMDKVGARRVLVFFSWIGVVLPLLHPLLPSVWAVVILQMILGLIATIGWVAGQTLVGQSMTGSHAEAGLLGFSARIGSLVAAPLAGLSWDLMGPWGGFALMTLWSVGLLAAALLLPKDRDGDNAPRRAFRLADTLPRYADYRAAFVLMRSPAMAIVVILSLINLAGGAIQTSFFVVYLEKIEFSATSIGTLAACYSIMAALGNLWAAPASRYLNAYWILFYSIVVGIVGVAITPLMTAFLPLMVVAVFRGTTQGITQPLMITAASRATDAGSQGKSVGLRIAMNRLSLSVVPIVMGAVVEAVGLENGFYAMGAGLLVPMIGIGFYMYRRPEFTGREK